MSITIEKTILHRGSGLVVAGAYYVSATGSASYAASQDNPSSPCSFSEAMLNAVAGDIVYFRGDTYTINRSGGSWDNPIMRPTNNGTSWASPITFIAYPGEVPIVYGSDGAKSDLDATAFGCNTGDQYIIWDGFSPRLSDSAQFDSDPSGGGNGYNTNMCFIMYGASNCRVRNFTGVGVVNGTPMTGGNTSPITIQLCDSVEVTNLTMYGNTGGLVNTCGMWIFESSNCTFSNMEVYSNNNGIMQKTGPNNNNVFHSIFFHDHTADSLYLNEQSASATGGTAVYNCLFTNCLGNAIYLSGSQLVIDYTFHGCVAYNCRTAIGYANPGTTGLSVYNCIWWTTDNPGVYFQSGANLPTMLDYNCYYRSGGYTWSLGGSVSTTLADWQTATGDEANSLNENPQFVNAGGTSPTDYALNTSLSNCDGAGYLGADIGLTSPSTVGVQ